MEIKPTDPFRSGNAAGMNTLSECLASAVRHGYTENFIVSEEGLKAPEHNRIYQPKEVEVINFFRFEGASNPDDMSILYAIEATDGLKGVLIDAYGTYADSTINDFILDVHRFNKQARQDK